MDITLECDFTQVGVISVADNISRDDLVSRAVSSFPQLVRMHHNVYNPDQKRLNFISRMGNRRATIFPILPAKVFTAIRQISDPAAEYAHVELLMGIDETWKMHVNGQLVATSVLSCEALLFAWSASVNIKRARSKSDATIQKEMETAFSEWNEANRK